MDKDKNKEKTVSASAKAAVDKPAAEVTKSRADSGLAYRVLLRRHLTEKTAAQEMKGKYTFIVSLNANKVMVADAVREVYGVKPTSVAIVKTRGKEVRRGKQVGRTKDVRKAIVTLKPGTTLPGMEAK